MRFITNLGSRSAWITAVALILTFGFTSVAAGQSSSAGTYGGDGPQGVLAGAGAGGPGVADAGGAASAEAAGAGALPFTGLDIGLALGGGLLLVGLGLALSRVAIRETEV